MRRFGIILVLLSGCMGSASIYYQDQHGGVLALHDNEGKAMKDAQSKMAAHCGPAGFQIVKRETVVVGRENYASSQRNYGADQVSAHAEDQAYGEHTETNHDEGGVTETQHVEGAAATPGGYVAGSDTVTTTDSDGHTDTTTTGVSSTRGNDQTSVRGGEQASSVSGVRDVTETRITYVCGSGAS
ncbi:MAG: hypothetical protein K8W52_06290 [Deltaproteobacteria bacterium]|nr:hypothetical protein [Deltaproteobacteria bacterium]